MARPTKYNPDIIPKVTEYFKNPHLYQDRVATKAGLSCVLNISKQTLLTWCDKHKALLDAVKAGEAYQERQIVEHLLDKEKYTSGAIFVAKNILGWADKQEVKNETTITGFEVVEDESSSESD